MFKKKNKTKKEKEPAAAAPAQQAATQQNTSQPRGPNPPPPKPKPGMLNAPARNRVIEECVYSRFTDLLSVLLQQYERCCHWCAIIRIVFNNLGKVQVFRAVYAYTAQQVGRDFH